MISEGPKISGPSAVFLTIFPSTFIVAESYRK